MSVAADSRRFLARAGLGAIALFVAGVVGCGAATGVMAVIGLFGSVPGVLFGALIGVATLPFWVGGLFIVGGPVWAVLHRMGYRDRRSAIIAGAVVAGVATPLILWGVFSDGRFTVDMGSALHVLASALPGAVGGAAAGYTAWRMGYDEARGA
ncbi:hypothetical protein [Brevundimonas sp.]|uniref:hypothetical protein n=1 Tax=Brevundimonas sp. TaxID=1871086 RepID=UPI002ED796EF